MNYSKLPSVLMFGWEFPPFNSGGLGVACEGLSKALAASGVDLNFVLPYKIKNPPPWCKFIFADEVTNFKDESELKKLFAGYQSHTFVETNRKFGLPARVSGSLVERVRAYAREAPAIAAKTPHSVIHAHDWLTYPAGLAAKEVSGRPLVAHVHATEFDRSGGESANPEIYNIEKAGFEGSDLIVAVSKRTREQVIRKYGVHPDKVKVVYNGIDFQATSSKIEHRLGELKSGGNSIVLFVGRITLQKGPDYFVQMAEKVLQFEPKTFFVISGSGDMEAEIIKKVSNKGLTKNFIFCGFLRGEELSRIYRAADIFVMPSVSEPFGLVPLEAMIAEVPVLISHQSGVSEIVQSALKSHFWDIDDMTDKVVSVLRHHKLKNHLQVSGKQEVRTIHWKKAANTLIALYNSLDNAFGMLLFPSSPATEGAQVSHF